MTRFAEALERAGMAQQPAAPSEADAFAPEAAAAPPPPPAASTDAPRPVPDRPRRLEAPVRVAPSVPQTGDDRQVASADPPLIAPTFHSFNKRLVEKLVIGEGAPSVMVEEYRRLAALLHNSQIAHGTKIVMISSAAPEEGKTLTASNLAITLSQSFMRRVLLIDADLREPSVHSVFDVENAAGLIHVLKDAQAGITDRRVPLVEVSPRLKVLLSGGVTHDPTALLTSDVLQKLLHDASEVFEWIIIDTPPAALVPDCNLIAGTVDAALLVIRAYATPYPLVQRAVEAIGRERILGVVMNRTEHTVGGDYRYLYEYGYGYGYGYGSDNRPPRS